jgi:cytochrome P450
MRFLDKGDEDEYIQSESILDVDVDKALSQINWDKDLPATSIPFTERVLEKDKIIQGQQLKSGQRIRLYLDAAGYLQKGVAYSELYFGAGSHTCIGKSFSKELWTVFTKCLSKVDLRLQIIKSTRKDHDYFFNGYYQLAVNVNS